MNDITHRLLAREVHPHFGDAIFREAAEQISLLRSGNQHMSAEIEALRQRLDDAMAALRPFKLAADAFDELNPRDHMELDAGGITVGDLRGARAVFRGARG